MVFTTTGETMNATTLGMAIGLTALVITGSGAAPTDAHQTRTCPYSMGEPCPTHYGHDLCNSLVYDLATAADVYDVDYIMHSAGCDQQADGTWRPVRTHSCERRAYWLLKRGYSILHIRQKLATRGCRQFEDGSYGA